MERYSYKVSKQGTRMDGAPLFKLVITHNFPVSPLFASSHYDELTGEELNFYISEIEKDNAAWMAVGK